MVSTPQLLSRKHGQGLPVLRFVLQPDRYLPEAEQEGEKKKKSIPDKVSSGNFH